MNGIKNLIKEKSIFGRSDTEKETCSNGIDFTDQYRQTVLPVFYYLFSRIQDVTDAEDLTSQTFLTAFENISKLRDPNKFTSWIFTIARNKAFDYFRKSKRHPTTNYDDDMEQNREKLSEADRESLLDLEILISKLSPAEQEYLRLRIVAELPFSEIALILNEPETRIKKKYYRLLDRLQNRMEK